MDVTNEPCGPLPLGVDGLGSDPAGWLGRGRLYALTSRVPSLRFPLIAATIESALACAMPCTLVVRSKPEGYLAQLNTPERMDLDAHLASGALGVLVMREEFGKRMFQLGASRFTRELSSFGVVPGSLVVFEHAADLLNMRDKGLATQQVEVLDAWCKEHHCTGLLVYSGNPDRNTLPVTDLLDGLAGLAVLEAGQGHLSIDFPYWRCADRLSGCRHFLLQLDSRGRYRVSHARDASAGASRVAVESLARSGDAGEAMPVAPPDADARFDPVAMPRVPALAFMGLPELREEASTQAHEGRPAYPAAVAAAGHLRKVEGRASIASGNATPLRVHATGRATRARLVEVEADQR